MVSKEIREGAFHYSITWQPQGLPLHYISEPCMLISSLTEIGLGSPVLSRRGGVARRRSGAVLNGNG